MAAKVFLTIAHCKYFQLICIIITLKIVKVPLAVYRAKLWFYISPIEIFHLVGLKSCVFQETMLRLLAKAELDHTNTHTNGIKYLAQKIDPASKKCLIHYDVNVIFDPKSNKQVYY